MIHWCRSVIEEMVLEVIIWLLNDPKGVLISLMGGLEGGLEVVMVEWVVACGDPVVHR